jgi:hypothetical protein
MEKIWNTPLRMNAVSCSGESSAFSPSSIAA